MLGSSASAGSYEHEYPLAVGGASLCYGDRLGDLRRCWRGDLLRWGRACVADAAATYIRLAVVPAAVGVVVRFAYRTAVLPPVVFSSLLLMFWWW